jgi:hypothetical protein
MHQPPRHRPNLVEEFERFSCLSSIDNASHGQDPDVNIDFFRRSERNAPKILAIATLSPMPLREIRRNR